MPSTRRWRVMAVVLVTLVVVVLYFSADARKAGSRDFVATTLQKLKEQDAEHAKVDQRVSERLKNVEDAVKKVVDETLPKRPDVLSQENEKASGDQKNMAGGKKDAEVKSQEKQTKPETEEEHQVEVELGSILKRSPIIIFSKSYCPYSKKAKSIFERYSIVPAPFVVELDEHPLGRQLQEELHRTTGRRTVPNILISGRSIGGGDDVAALHSQGELMNKVQSMGGKRIMEAKLKKGG